MTWVPVPRRDLRDIYDCPRWFERAILKSRQYGEPAEYVVWVGQGERSQIICTLWDMEAPLPLEPVAELADGAIFRVNAAFDSAGARQSAYAARVSGEPAVRSDFDVIYQRQHAGVRQGAVRPRRYRSEVLSAPVFPPMRLTSPTIASSTALTTWTSTSTTRA